MEELLAERPALEQGIEPFLSELNEWPDGVEMPPTEDELPYEDGEPMESTKHHLQMTLLIQTLEQYYHTLGRDDVAVHGNMGIYFSLEQARKQNFRAPDFFVVLGAKERRLRKSWVIWQEERVPNLVIELLSESTKAADRGVKKQIYQDVMRVPEYILHDVVGNTFEAFRLHAPQNGHSQPYYEPIDLGNDPLRNPVFFSEQLRLELVLWEGEFEYYWDVWLRWRNPKTGEILPTSREIAQGEYRRAEQERNRAEQERNRAEQERNRAEQERNRAEQEKNRAEQERERAERLAEKLRALGIDPNEA